MQGMSFSGGTRDPVALLVALESSLLRVILVNCAATLGMTCKA